MKQKVVDSFVHALLQCPSLKFLKFPGCFLLRFCYPFLSEVSCQPTYACPIIASDGFILPSLLHSFHLLNPSGDFPVFTKKKLFCLLSSIPFRSSNTPHCFSSFHEDKEISEKITVGENASHHLPPSFLPVQLGTEQIPVSRNT